MAHFHKQRSRSMSYKLLRKKYDEVDAKRIWLHAFDEGFKNLQSFVFNGLGIKRNYTSQLETAKIFALHFSLITPGCKNDIPDFVVRHYLDGMPELVNRTSKKFGRKVVPDKTTMDLVLAPSSEVPPSRQSAPIKKKKTKKKMSERVKPHKDPTGHRKKYYEYLESQEWKDKRDELFRIRGRRCERCNSSKNIQVHHLTYERVFNELLNDLEVLCKTCHEIEHGIRKPERVIEMNEQNDYPY